MDYSKCKNIIEIQKYNVSICIIRDISFFSFYENAFLCAKWQNLIGQ